MIRLTILTFFFLLCMDGFSQSKDEIPSATSGGDRVNNKAIKKELENSSLVKDIPFRNVGPTIMSGRVTDLAVDPNDFKHFYVAYASGGLWETNNGGVTYKPLFDDQIVMSIGDIAVNWKTKTIYVGTGENNSSRSSYSGAGVFKSTNNGKTWTHLGLEDTHRIGRIVLHPGNDQILWVAAAGHLYSDNQERGVYKSNNGGRTWAKTLFVDGKTGAIDLVIDPVNTNNLYAAMWQRDRKAWNFDGSGTGSGIYRSTDGGQHWEEVSGGNSGFPDTKGTGRIGLAIYPKNPKIIYALLDNQDRRPEEQKGPMEGLTKEQIKGMDKAAFLALDDSLLNNYLKENRFPKRYDFAEVKRLVKASEARPADIANYFEDANAQLFNTPVIGAELYRSDDGGTTWKRTHKDFIDNMYYSYGYYFGEVRVAPNDPDQVYALGVPIIKSEDAGKTWRDIGGDNQHGDHQALWVDSKGRGLLISGNDGGVNISYDDGKSWLKSNPHAVGQFYDINFDMDEPYNVYGGLQDNGVWWGSSQYEFSTRWHMSGKYPWQLLMWGDGMQTEVDTRDNNTVYTGFQFGHYYRINKTTGEDKKITPMHDLGEDPFRWNWEAPIHLSRHNQDVIYMGSNRLHKSTNQGNDFDSPSEDLTKGGKQTGNVSYGTLTVIAESPMKEGLIYIGTDDGVVQVTQDGGGTWTIIDPNLTRNYWVSSIVPSSFKEGRVYLTLNGYRWDQFDAMVYVSENYGKIWRALGTNLPKEAINVIAEDPVKEEILYLGTDHGAYASIDRGSTFMPLGGGLPNVAVHDLAVHPRENELIIGTHGRSIYIGDITAIQNLTTLERKETLKILSVDKVKHSKNWGEYKYGNQWNGFDEPDCTITFYSKSAGKGQLKIMNGERQMFSTTVTIGSGLNFFQYDLSRSGEAAEDGTPLAKNGKVYLEAGEYALVINANQTTVKEKLNVSAE